MTNHIFLVGYRSGRCIIFLSHMRQVGSLGPDHKYVH